MWRNIWNNYCDTICEKDINERIILKRIMSEIYKYFYSYLCMNFIYIILRQFIRYIIIIILSNRIDSLSDWWDSSLRSAFLELVLCACLYFLLNCSACPWLVFDLLLNCSALPWVVQPLVTWNSQWSSRNMGDAPSKSSCIRTLTLQGNLDLLLGDSDDQR